MDPVFAGAAGVCVVSALVVVTRRNPLYSALWLLLGFLAFAVVYLKLEAPFLAAMHVLVYTGAILVLFLFVIMLLNLKPREFPPEPPRALRLAAGAGCAGLFALVAIPIALQEQWWKEPPALAGSDLGTVEQVGHVLFTTYGLPFELLSVLVLTAIFGGVILASRDRKDSP